MPIGRVTEDRVVVEGVRARPNPVLNPATIETMKIVPLNEVKNRFSTYLELSKHEDIVVTKNGRPAAILHAVTDEDIEDYLFESDPRFIARIEALRREFQRGGGTPLADVRRELRVPVSRQRRPATRRHRTSVA